MQVDDYKASFFPSFTSRCERATTAEVAFDDRVSPSLSIYCSIRQLKVSRLVSDLQAVGNLSSPFPLFHSLSLSLYRIVECLHIYLIMSVNAENECEMHRRSLFTDQRDFACHESSSDAVQLTPTNKHIAHEHAISIIAISRESLIRLISALLPFYFPCAEIGKVRRSFNGAPHVPAH